MYFQVVQKDDWNAARRNFQKLESNLFGPQSKPPFNNIILTGLTTNSLIYPDSDKLLTSLGVAANGKIPIGSTGTTPVLAEITGTANQVNIANGAGSIILSTPQDIDQTATPTFAGMILDGTIAIGLDMSGGTFATAVQNWPATPVINVVGTQTIKFDDALNNVLLGTSAFANDEGQYNVGLGYQAGFNNDTIGGGIKGQYNIYIGRQAGYGATPATTNTGFYNVFIGTNTGRNNTSGHSNFGLGVETLQRNTSGSKSVAIGVNALLFANTSDNNVAIGYQAMKGTAENSQGNNTIIGTENHRIATTSNNNTSVGFQCGYYVIAADENCLYGWRSGFRLTSGSSNIFLGYNSGVYQTTNSDRLIIDNQDRGSAAAEITTSLMYGVFAAVAADQSLRINGDVIIGNGSEQRFLDVGNSNYVGFQAPALTADQIWTLPDTDGIEGDVLATDGSGILKWNSNASEKTWGFDSPTGSSGAFFFGGYYSFETTDDDFSGGPTWGTANVSYAAHFMIVLGAQTVDELTIRVTGTSITDQGTRTGGDTEDIVIPNTTAVDTYYETDKKWLGQVTITVVSGTAKTCNYGWAKYWDNNNADYTIKGVEAVWLAGANDTNIDIQLLHHRATGWTFNVGAKPTFPTPIATLVTDHGTDDQAINGENGAWKRDNLDIDIDGSNEEGALFCVITTANKTFELGNLMLRIVPQ